MKDLKDLKDNILSFFNSMSIEAIQFLTWTSPIVAALLALTTIVFSQYNERLLNRSNQINNKLISLFRKDLIQFEEITTEINNLLFILKGKSFYSFNLFFFTLISLISFWGWLLGGIGYFVKYNTNSGNTIIILLGLLAITLTFFILPIILIIFNKKPIITLDFKNRLSYKKLAKYIRSITSITETSIISNILQPSLDISLNAITKKLTFNFKHRLPVSNIYIVYEFVGKEFSRQIIKYINNSIQNSEELILISTNEKANNYEGLYNKLNNCQIINLYIFTQKENELIASFKLQKQRIDDNNFSINIKEEFNLNSNEKINNILLSKHSCIDYKGKEIFDYSLSKKS